MKLGRFRVSVIRATVATTAVALGGLASAVSAIAEPNDTMATAQGPATQSITGAISTENDVDWYFIYALGSTQLDIALTGLGPETSCYRWAVELKDSNGYDLSSTTAGFNEVDHILYSLPTPGTYYLEVRGVFCEAVGNYRIDLAASPGLLTSPPYVPPPPPVPSTTTVPSSPSAARAVKACERARTRVAGLRRKLRRARGVNYSAAIRQDIRRARANVRRKCR